jgi:hypothetical protein
MNCKDFDVRKKGAWTYIGFWCNPENDDDAQKLSAVLRRIMSSLAEEMNDTVDFSTPDGSEAGAAN